MQNDVVLRRLIATLSLAAFVTACSRDVKPPILDSGSKVPPPGPEPVHEMPTCGPTGLGRDSAIADGRFPSGAISWTTWNIPEYQDKQRFAPGNSGEPYGPVACVVARPDLETVKDADYTVATGVLVAIVYVYPEPGSLPSQYTQMNMEKEFNCVILRKSAAGGGDGPSGIDGMPEIANSTDWEGFIVPSRERQCDPIAGRAALPVVALGSSSTTATDYPAVARFAVKKNWRPGVGVRCGSKWCLVGLRRADIPRPVHLASIGSSTGARRVRRLVPGWYDDQELATPRTGGGLKANPHASIVPDEGLDGYTMTANFDLGYTPVATVYFEGTPPGKYTTKWHFIAGDAGNTMELKHTGGRWWVKINGTEYDDTHFKVTRSPHVIPSFHIVGTARWAWTETDEYIWVRCDEGCCLVEPIGAG